MNNDNLAINTLRFLSVDAIQKANSGHPGLPLGAAPTAYTLWSKHLKHNPKNPTWQNRDRFILSAGHGSSLLYSMLYLFGYGLTIDDLQNFRKFGSLTPGHPEYKHTVGVEVTTGPLGQGIANGVGMALAESYLANTFNKDNFDIVDHYTYVLCGDGCLQEGVSSEACSLAGTMGLGKLILLYDSNNITIEGDTNISFREDVKKRYEAYDWQVLYVEDGNDVEEISRAIETAKKEKSKPTLIEVKTKIGYGSPNKQGTAKAHGEPLGVDEIKLAKENLGFDYPSDFSVPSEVTEQMNELQKELNKKEEEWNTLLNDYKAKYPKEYAEYELWHDEKIGEKLLDNEDFWNYEGGIATRASSEKVLNKACKIVPNLFGGSADLAPSNKSIMAGRGDYSKETPTGANLHFGIREFAMSAMANGIYLHGGLRPYVAGFFIFSDYMKPAQRLSALMDLPVINILTHDSIGVGEDGPTHQPVEQLAMLRSLPNFTVMRPCDTNETAAAWYLALTRQSPSALALTRQNLPLLEETGKKAIKGGYILKDCNGTPDVILIASGSEVSLCLKAYNELTAQGVNVRLVSMMSIEVFEEQSDEYKQSVLPNEVTKRLVVEAGSSFGWHKYTGFEGKIISIDTFGASAPADQLFEHYGFTVENVVKTATSLLK